jgi:hypothetical protein
MCERILKFFWLFLFIPLLLPHSVQAASGTPNSPNFGYGARVYLNGENPRAAIQEAGNFNLDWIAIDFDWQQMQPEAGNPPDWNNLDTAMAAAAESQISVLITITRAPDWAINENGPDKQKTAELASKLANRYSGTLLALELFPYANTSQGWGVEPNPIAYAKLLKATAKAVEEKVILVAGGLKPIYAASEGMDDVDFLRQLYSAGAVDYMPIVSVRLPASENDPLTSLHQANGYTLRHYENIHNTMLDHGHNNGLIWVTGFAWDSFAYGSTQDQANWLKQAYLLMRSQLYIGAAFFDGLNSSDTDAMALLLPGGTHHLGFKELVQLIALDNDGQTVRITLGIPKQLSDKNLAKGR